MPQGIPNDPPRAQDALHNEHRRGRSGTNWAHHHAAYIQEWASDDHIIRGPIFPDTRVSRDYLEWYRRVTRQFITPGHVFVHTGYQPGHITYFPHVVRFYICVYTYVCV